MLDVGSGMGRVSEALRRRGHRVVAAEPDPELVEQSRRTYPDVAVVPSTALGLDAALLGEHGHPAAYDLVVMVGNVMVFLAEGTERATLARLRDLLAPGGRILVGFELVATKSNARSYPPEEFVADVEAAGLASTCGPGRTSSTRRSTTTPSGCSRARRDRTLGP